MSDWRTCKHEWLGEEPGDDVCLLCGNDKSLLDSHAALLAACQLGGNGPISDKTVNGPTFLRRVADLVEITAGDGEVRDRITSGLRVKADAEEAASKRAREVEHG